MAEELLRNIRRGSHLVVECLLRAKADANTQDQSETGAHLSALHMAAGHPRIVVLLLLHKVSPPHLMPRTPFHMKRGVLASDSWTLYAAAPHGGGPGYRGPGRYAA